MRFSSPLAAAAAALVAATAAQAETPRGAADRLDAFLDRFEGIEPGYAVVAVTADEVLLNRVEGVRRARERAERDQHVGDVDAHAARLVEQETLDQDVDRPEHGVQVHDRRVHRDLRGQRPS